MLEASLFVLSGLRLALGFLVLGSIQRGLCLTLGFLLLGSIQRGLGLTLSFLLLGSRCGFVLIGGGLVLADLFVLLGLLLPGGFLFRREILLFGKVVRHRGRLAAAGHRRRRIPRIRRRTWRLQWRHGGLRHWGVALFGLLPDGIGRPDGLLDLLDPLGRELALEFRQAFFDPGEFLLECSHIVIRRLDAAILVAPVCGNAALLHFIGVRSDMGGRLAVNALVF